MFWFTPRRWIFKSENTPLQWSNLISTKMFARHKLVFVEIKKCRKCRKMANLAIPSTFSLKTETWRGPPSKVSPPPRVMLYAADRRKNKCSDASSQENQAITKFYRENENASRLPSKCRHFPPQWACLIRLPIPAPLVFKARRWGRANDGSSWRLQWGRCVNLWHHM